MKQWDVIYEYPGTYHIFPAPRKTLGPTVQRVLGFAFFALGLGGLLGPFIPTIRLESDYYMNQIVNKLTPPNPQLTDLPAAVPVVLDPLLTLDGASIKPINEDFAIIVPKVGINAAVIPDVNPMQPNEYQEALKTGVAHASTSFLPDEEGTVYLFSHSTNYDWFVDDLNAVFYLLKNLEKDDSVVIIYKGKRYTYKITEKKVVSPRSTTYLYPYIGRRNLVLQTCWPPGSVSQRLLIFADLIEEQTHNI